MKTNKIVLLNAAILTNFGNFEFSEISLHDAKDLVSKTDKVESAIGHKSTAELLTDLLDHPVEQNRIEYKQKIGEKALIFRLKSRPPEGEVLNKEEVEKIGFEFGVLERVR